MRPGKRKHEPEETRASLHGPQRSLRRRLRVTDIALSPSRAACGLRQGGRAPEHIMPSETETNTIFHLHRELKNKANKQKNRKTSVNPENKPVVVRGEGRGAGETNEGEDEVHASGHRSPPGGARHSPGSAVSPVRTPCGDHGRHGEHFVTHAAVQVLRRTPETTVTGVSGTLQPEMAV